MIQTLIITIEVHEDYPNVAHRMDDIMNEFFDTAGQLNDMHYPNATVDVDVCYRPIDSTLLAKLCGTME